MKKNYGDEGKTEITDAVREFQIEDLIADEEMVVSISHLGYIKRVPISTYRRQNRGGKGVIGMGTKDDDFLEHIFIASAHQSVFDTFALQTVVPVSYTHLTLPTTPYV